jgi:hypothetical protein
MRFVDPVEPTQLIDPKNMVGMDMGEENMPDIPDIFTERLLTEITRRVDQ